MAAEGGGQIAHRLLRMCPSATAFGKKAPNPKYLVRTSLASGLEFQVIHGAQKDKDSGRKDDFAACFDHVNSLAWRDRAESGAGRSGQPRAPQLQQRLGCPSALVGVDFGFFDAAGLVINGLQGDNTEGVINSVVIGTSDFALLPQRAMLAMAASDFDFAVVSMNSWGTEMELAAKASDSATKSIKDLKGKTVLVGSGSEALPVLIRLLNAAQMTIQDLTIVRVPSGQLVESFGQPNSHAVFDTRHYTKSLTDQKIGRVVTSNKGVEQAIGRIGRCALDRQQEHTQRRTRKGAEVPERLGPCLELHPRKPRRRVGLPPLTGSRC